MTASADIIENSQRHIELKDSRQRILKIRRLNALDRLRLLKAAGPELSQNDSWLDIAALAASVIEIDGIPRMIPTNERLIESAVAELDDAGLTAIAEALRLHDDNSLFAASNPRGNAAGTSS